MKRNFMFRAGLCAFLGLGAGGALATPQWWTDRGVLSTNPAQNRAAANQGQLKYIASKAAEEYQQQFPLLDLSEITGLVSGFNTNNNHAAVNLGQLKYVAQPFYDVLGTHSLLTNAWPSGMISGPYPWSGSTNASQDYALANLGQLKYIFSMGLDSWYSSTDTDGDGLPDDWEVVNGINPAVVDTDGDGISDFDEIQNGTDPTVFDGAGGDDADGDGVSDHVEEFQNATNPHDRFD